MTTIIISDLSNNTEISKDTMKKIHGGTVGNIDAGRGRGGIQKHGSQGGPIAPLSNHPWWKILHPIQFKTGRN